MDMKYAVLVMGVAGMVGCSDRSLEVPDEAGRCTWSFTSPQSSGSQPAGFDYAADNGCIGPTKPEQAFGFTVMEHDDTRLFRVSFGSANPHPSDGEIVDLASSKALMLIYPEACVAMTGTAKIVSSAPSYWRVEFHGVCQDGGEVFDGIISGDTINARPING